MTAIYSNSFNIWSLLKELNILLWWVTFLMLNSFISHSSRRSWDSCHENSILLNTRMIKKCLNFQINFHVLHFSPETLILSRVGNESLWRHNRNETSDFSPLYRKVRHHHLYSSQGKTEKSSAILRHNRKLTARANCFPKTQNGRRLHLQNRT